MMGHKNEIATALFALFILCMTQLSACSLPFIAREQSPAISPVSAATEKEQQENIQFAQFVGKYQADPNKLDEVINEYLIQSVKDIYYNPGGPSYVMHEQIGAVEKENNEIDVMLYFVFRNCFIENEVLDYSGCNSLALITLKNSDIEGFIPQKIEFTKDGGEYESSFRALFEDPYYQQCADYMAGENPQKLQQQITSRMEKSFEKYRAAYPVEANSH